MAKCQNIVASRHQSEDEISDSVIYITPEKSDIGLAIFHDPQVKRLVIQVSDRAGNPLQAQIVPHSTNSFGLMCDEVKDE